MKKVALIIPPQSFNFNEVKLSEIKKKIKIKISASFKKIYKKQFYWNYIFLKKNFNKYKFNIAILMGIILSAKKTNYKLYAGISVGEYLALYYLDLDNTIDLVLKRSKILYDENLIVKGIMISITGLNIYKFKKIIKEKIKEPIYISVIYSDTFFCISLKKKTFKELKKILKKKNVNFSVLKNNGPWHSKVIIKARPKIEKLINSYRFFFNKNFLLLSNYTGSFHKNENELKRNLINQTFNVARWDKNLIILKNKCNFFCSPFQIKTISKIMYLTNCNIKEI